MLGGLSGLSIGNGMSVELRTISSLAGIDNVIVLGSSTHASYNRATIKIDNAGAGRLSKDSLFSIDGTTYRSNILV